MPVAGYLRPRIIAHGFVPEDDTGQFDLLRQSAAAMIGEPRVVVAEDPCPFESAGEIAQQGPCLLRQPLAAESVVEAVAETIEPARSRRPDELVERRQGRDRIIGGKELAQPREPARLLEVQIGDEQRFPGRPVERAFGRCRERFACERKGNHVSVIAGSGATKQSNFPDCFPALAVTAHSNPST